MRNSSEDRPLYTAGSMAAGRCGKIGELASRGRLIELASEKAVELFASRILLEELAATLAKKKLA